MTAKVGRMGTMETLCEEGKVCEGGGERCMMWLGQWEDFMTAKILANCLYKRGRRYDRIWNRGRVDNGNIM